ncbi:ABC transporter ATP-binding protein [Citroniella saccharovorans]|uniref:ABC transporter ATP-binding protein n=1 Tax=Citroniella saccharovorans TaxID=2053367 RepID=A0AAW9MVG2_9FIRM|nr:ABC transporter ATP-binding protein [Citroniella saccharovorans]MEB3428480.1 ABC transporter ATP-binding protein [Citroniella saccharovorans]
MKEICRLENIVKKFNMGEEVTPLYNLNLTVNEGDFIIIEGPSGSGKSTLLYLIGTLLKADQGKYFFEGKNIDEYNDSGLSNIRARKIGFLFQESNLIQALTLRQNIEFVSKEKKIDSKELTDLLKKLGLDDRENFLPFQLSGGQRRRAGLARSIICKPKLILADEPTNDLDQKWSDVVMNLLVEKTKENSAVVMVTHNKDLIKFASKSYLLKDGSLKNI